jgi:hypothetical protein
LVGVAIPLPFPGMSLLLELFEPLRLFEYFGGGGGMHPLGCLAPFLLLGCLGGGGGRPFPFPLSDFDFDDFEEGQGKLILVSMS